MKVSAGQVAVITGGASGIGLGLAEEFGSRGLKVVVSDIRSDAIDAAIANLQNNGVECMGIVTDVADPVQVDQLAEASIARFGHVDIVCNNAGVVCKMAPMWEQTHQTWQWLTDVGLLGIVSGVRAFAPHFLERGVGHFVNTASVGGLTVLPYLTPYNAVKHAVVGMTESLNVELRGVNPEIGASVLCPGLVRTALGETSAMLKPAGAEVTEVIAGARSMDDAAAEFGLVLNPRDVAVATIEAIEAGRVHIMPAGAGAGDVKRRVESVLNDIPPKK